MKSLRDGKSMVWLGSPTAHEESRTRPRINASISAIEVAHRGFILVERSAAMAKTFEQQSQSADEAESVFASDDSGAAASVQPQLRLSSRPAVMHTAQQPIVAGMFRAEIKAKDRGANHNLKTALAAIFNEDPD